MWLGKDPSHVEADPCPRIRARVSAAGFSRSRLPPQCLGVLQHPPALTPRPRGERSPSAHLLTETHHSPHRTPPAAPTPPLEGCPSPERLFSSLTAFGECSPPERTSRLLATPEKRGLPRPALCSRPQPPRARAGRYLSGGASRACGRRGLSWPHTPPAANPQPLSNPARICPAAAASAGAPCEEGAQLRDPGP